MKSHGATAATIAERRHSEGVRLYGEGRFEEAAQMLESGFREEPTSELANDWGAAELASGRTASAERSFTEALRLDPGNADAAANLGALLAGRGLAKEAVPFLELAIARGDGTQKGALEQLLATCRTKVTSDALNESVAALGKIVAVLQSWRLPEPAPALRAPVYMGNNRALLCTTNHCKMYVDTTDLLIAPWLLMHAEWEPEETALMKRLLKPDDVFVDVGANIGYYTLLAVRLGASQVYAFEPQASTHELLSKNVIINWMTSVVRCENLAVFSHTTDLEFFARKNYPGNSSIGSTAPDQLAKWFDTAEKLTLHAVSLDEYFLDKPGKIQVMKVDVEGAEPAAFEGARRILSQNRDIKVLCEWSPDQMATAKQDPARLVTLWAELGFRAFALHTGLGEVSLKSLLKSGYQNLLLHR
jgi:FkbM family methyltransferase